MSYSRNQNRRMMDRRSFPGVVALPIPGTAQGHFSIIRIESGEEIQVSQGEDNSLRYWGLHYRGDTSRVAAGISLVDTE